MPVGVAECLPFVLRIAHEIEWSQGTLKVLDLGAGYGFWGAAIRNYCGTDPSTGRICAGGKALRITGIECWEPYRSPLWGAYDEMIVGRIEDNLSRIDSADLVVAIDVLEHLPEPLACEIMDRAHRFVVGVPEQWEQGAVYGNESERHVSMWTVDKMRPHATTITYMPNFNPLHNPGESYIVGLK